VKGERLKRWLGNTAGDPGCEACFEAFDQYADALLRGEAGAKRFAEVVTHLENCAACREDAEGLLAILRNPPPNDEQG
jgi:hypothetical protein